MQLKSTLAVALLLALAACTTNPAPNANSTTPLLTGQPSWLAVGSEVYQESEADGAATQILPLRIEPRWFTGFQHAGTRKEYEKTHPHEHNMIENDQRPDGSFPIPSPPPYPKSAMDLPTNTDGITLQFHLSPGQQPGTILFVLTLHSEHLPLSREFEHRYTNILPFLFAFYVDGKAITVPSHGWGKTGGIVSMRKILDPGQSRHWQVQVKADTLAPLLPDNKPHLLTAIAAFSNSQHQGYIPGGHLNEVAFIKPPPTEILVRSNPASLTWNGNAWQTSH